MPQAETPAPSQPTRLGAAAIAKARALWDRARRERSTPREIALSVAVGVFAGCTPFIGFHMWIALALSTALRLNRLWAFLASRFSIMPVFVLTTFLEVEAGCRVRTGAWAALSPAEAFARKWELLTDLATGTAIVGGLAAAAAGALAYAVALSASAPVAALPPSSESPP